MLEVSGLNVYYDNIRALNEIIQPDIATDDIYVTLGSACSHPSRRRLATWLKARSKER